MIITEKAKNKILSLNTKDRIVRLIIDCGGCHGFQYKFIIDDNIIKEELYNDLVLIDQTTKTFLNENSIIDFINNIQDQKLILKVNDSMKYCGCGTSFSL